MDDNQRHAEGWIPCQHCDGRGTVRVPGGHGDTDTVLCEACNPERLSRASGFPGPDRGWQRQYPTSGG